MAQDSSTVAQGAPTLTERSAFELAAMIRRGEVTSREVVEAHIARLAISEPRSNAIAVFRYTDAREEADAADARIAAAGPDEVLPPLLGVPCTIKEAIAVKGLPNTAGFLPAAGRVSTENAPAVQRIFDAGAIPLGLTNTSELCLWIESQNPVYGRTTNPYDVGRTVGGSSGGEGAVLGAGGSPFGLGSDLAGSIRVPAFCCGVFGHKPSTGIVPTTGHFPMGQGESRRMMVIGPMSRRATDLMPLLELLSGPVAEDPFAAAASQLGDPADVSFEGMKVVLPGGLLVNSGVSRELVRERDRVAAHLQSLGADVRRVRGSALAKVDGLFVAALRSGWTDAFHEEIGWTQETNRRMISDLRHGRNEHSPAFVNLNAIIWAAQHLVPDSSPAWFDRMRAKLTADIQEVIGDGVMLLPPMPRAAPPHGWTLLRPWTMQTMVAANMLGWPTTQVPTGFGREGLPLGVQVMADAGGDHKTIAVALELERAFGGWVPPEHAPAAPAPAVRRGEGVRRVAGVAGRAVRRTASVRPRRRRG